MKVVLVNCFDTYADRTECLRCYFEEKADEVYVIEPDFQHIKKERVEKKEKGLIQVQVPEYRRNLSIKRMKSHVVFAQRVREVIEAICPDIIYALIPPNSLVKEMSRFKTSHPKVKMIFDVMDLWPETMPIPLVKKYFPFSLWKKLRDKNINCADYIITECDLYQKILKNVLNPNKTRTIYLVRKEYPIKSEYAASESMNIGYIGSVNNIIDIQVIQNILRQLAIKYDVTFRVIGKGESKAILLQKAQEAGVKVLDYGAIYEKSKKMEILSQCDFGMNIMKKTVCVGLTTKSIDYFEAGMPVINNIQGDTFELVEQYGVGINVDFDGCIDLDKISKMKQDMKSLRNRVHHLYREKFLYNVFVKQMDEILQEIM